MKTHTCHAACGNRVALREEARVALHKRCPGAYLTPNGEFRQCRCECHGDEAVTREATEGLRLDVLTPPRADVPAATDKADERPFVASGSTSRGGSTPARRCEHCGEPCRGRFVVGHDAKLKSELAQAASEGDAHAWAELELRNWSRLVKAGKVSEEIQELGQQIAFREGERLVVERNAIRAGLRS